MKRIECSVSRSICPPGGNVTGMISCDSSFAVGSDDVVIPHATNRIVTGNNKTMIKKTFALAIAYVSFPQMKVLSPDRKKGVRPAEIGE